jgi:hypothetical protein
MRGKLMVLGGLAAGFVLGRRAGRQAYDELVRTAKKVKESPSVQEAAGVVQAQATKVYEQGKATVTDKLGNTRFGDRLLHSTSDEPVAVGTTTTTSNSSGTTLGSLAEWSSRLTRPRTGKTDWSEIGCMALSSKHKRWLKQMGSGSMGSQGSIGFGLVCGR